MRTAFHFRKSISRFSPSRNLGLYSMGLMLIFGSIFFISTPSFATNELPQTFTLDGQLMLNGTTTALSDTNAKLVIEILDPSKNCLLYEEQQYINTAASDGYFTIQVGSSTGNAKRTTLDPGQAMAQIYQNTVAIVAASAPGKTCAGGTYTPAAGDSRYLRLIVTPSSTNVADTLAPDTLMDSVPLATTAQTLQGYNPSQFLILGNGDLTQANLTSVFASGNAAKLDSLLSIPPANYITTDTTSGAVQIPSVSGTPTGVTAGEVWYDSGTLKYYDGTNVDTLTTSAALPDAVINGGQTGAVLAGPSDANAMTLQTAGTPRVTVSPTGLVGIGTTSPSGGLLDIEPYSSTSTSSLRVAVPNPTTAQYPTIAMEVYGANLGTYPTFAFKSASGTATAPVVTAANTVLGIIVGQGQYDTTPGHFRSGADMLFVSSSAFTSTSSAGYLAVRTTPSGSTGPTERFRIDPSGNVGIGTTSPASRLHVGVAPTATAHYPLFALGSGPFDGSTAGFFTGNASGTVIGVNTATGYAGDLLNLQIAGVSKFKVDASGNITTTNGKIGIATVSPAYQLDVVGDINSSTVFRIAGTQICSSSGCTSSSDRRLKENIVPLQNSLDNILKLQGVTYDWKDKDKYGHSQQVGLIAQDLEKVYPQVVVTDSKTGLKSVAYDHLVAPLIEALKTLNSKISSLERHYQEILTASSEQSRDIASVKTENAQLKARAEKAEKENAEIKTRLDHIEKTLNAK